MSGIEELLEALAADAPARQGEPRPASDELFARTLEGELARSEAGALPDGPLREGAEAGITPPTQPPVEDALAEPVPPGADDAEPSEAEGSAVAPREPAAPEALAAEPVSPTRVLETLAVAPVAPDLESGVGPEAPAAALPPSASESESPELATSASRPPVPAFPLAEPASSTSPTPATPAAGAPASSPAPLAGAPSSGSDLPLPPGAAASGVPAESGEGAPRAAFEAGGRATPPTPSLAQDAVLRELPASARAAALEPSLATTASAPTLASLAAGPVAPQRAPRSPGPVASGSSSGSGPIEEPGASAPATARLLDVPIPAALREPGAPHAATIASRSTAESDPTATSPERLRGEGPRTSEDAPSATGEARPGASVNETPAPAPLAETVQPRAAADLGGLEATLARAGRTPEASVASSAPGTPPGEALPLHTEWLAARGGGTARITLHPPELGDVDLTVRVRGDRVDVVARVREPAAQAALSDQRGQLVDSLAARQLRVDNFEVVPFDRDAGASLAERDAAREQGARPDAERGSDPGTDPESQDPDSKGAQPDPGRNAVPLADLPLHAAATHSTSAAPGRIDVRI